MLATSRTRLLLPYERVYVVPGLSVIGGGGDAVDLFAARVTAATGDPTPPDPVRVAALCRALDGMALAIELAAARFAALGLDGLESGLDQRLRLLTAGPRAADRHASLRAAIGWSYDLLSPADRALLRGVAVFASWFEVDAARAVAGASRDRAEIADGLARLAEHSLLVVERGERTRYRALETIRQYGVERLDQAGELDQIRAGHERWCRRALAALGQTGTADIDDAWCARFDRIVDDAGAALAWSAGQESRRAQAAELAAELAGLLFLRGRPAQAQRRYEQGAELATTATERAALLRQAAGAAASRFAGDDALRLFRMAADAALTAGDRAGAARDLATMAMYINRAPGIMASQHSQAEADALIAKSQALSDGSPLAQAALAVAECHPPPGTGDPRRAVELAERADDGIVHSIALDWLTVANLADDDIAEAVRTARRRLELLGTLPVGPLTGFEFADDYLMAAEVDLAAGDLPGAAAHADALAGLPFYRHEDHLAMSRRLLVDALAGHFDDVVQTGERFRAGWERAGRPVAPNLARAPYAVAMVHGMRGRRRAPGGLGTPDDRPRRRPRAARRMPAGLAAGVRRAARARPQRPGRGRAATRGRHRRPRAVPVLGLRDVAAVVRRAVGGGRRARPPPRRRSPYRAKPSRCPRQPDRNRHSRTRRRDHHRRPQEARPPRDHLRPARLPLPAGKNRPDRRRAARSAPVSVNAKNRAESAGCSAPPGGCLAVRLFGCPRSQAGTGSGG